MFLSPRELHELTGYQKPALQRRWLVEHSYRFDVRADGRAVVLTAAIEQQLAGRRTSGAGLTGRPWSSLPCRWVAADRTTNTCPRGVTLEWGTYYFRGPDRKRLNLGRDFADAMRQYGELFRETPLTTFGAVLDRYMREITPKKAPRTQIDEHGYISTLRGMFGDMPPRSITPVIVAQLRDGLAARSSDVQADHDLKTLKYVFKVATEMGTVPSNPAHEISKLKANRASGTSPMTNSPRSTQKRGR